MTAVAIRGRRVVVPGSVIEDGAVVIEGERIVATGRADELVVASDVAFQCDVVMPGFIDMHTHGAGGRSFGEGASAAREIARGMAQNGVTTVYAGLGHGATLEAVSASVAAAAAAVGETGGARLGGIFLEGPYISPERKGAWTAAHLRAPAIPELEQLVEAAGGHLRRINVAPELAGATEFIRHARARGIVVSIGHSNATYSDAVAAIEAGATIANHTYNAMSPLAHRAPGLVGAVLARDELLAELIFDGVHVHPAAAKALYRARGAGGVALITDSVLVAGQPDGVYKTGSRTLTVRDGSCCLPDGTLAGSVATFDQCVRNAARHFECGLGELALISATNAAGAMGIGHETGSITPGRFADLVLLNDRLQPQATMVRGSVVFESQASEGQPS